jgi:hypothetical protein
LLGLPVILILVALLFVCSSEANAQTLTSPNHQTVVLELYTSQGCSSCPPAERWISGFTDDPKLWNELIPINFRVDYWDYLGWKDRYSNPLFSARQRRYQHIGNSRTVATPGFIVNGQGWYGWFYKRGIRAESLSNAGVLSVSLPESIRLTEDALSEQQEVKSDNIAINYELPASNTPPLMAHLVILGFGLEDHIERGENRGETFVQDFVVLDYASQPLVSGKKSAQSTLTAPKRPDHKASRFALAVWVSQLHDPSPIQAVGNWIEFTEK